MVNDTNMACVLVECSFVDSKSDMDRYNSSDFATAIIKAITGQVAIQRPPNSVIVSIQKLCNSLGVKDNKGNALVVDGIIGPCTRSAILKLPVIQRGSKGNFVKWVQERLIDLGFSCGSYGADGDFGYCTLVAVQNFQAKNGLASDGRVRQSTLIALLK
ncbi:MAG: peptidoglycan-binding protein [Clostridiaceae bacterium]|nr:peptidoglycan-binding protein [Clostridiaceae bacterium]